MCYLARQHQAPVDDGVATRPEHVPAVRPRWVGAGVAAALVAGFAGAALLAPLPDPPAATDEASVGPQPIVSTGLGAPPLEAGSVAPDDGVPSVSDESTRAAAQQNCHHAI
ncbi:hypothetical protein EZ313_20255 [Ramlibacter henchirensis]|uniref:Uncharacterized protein n=1 Tax=Ramlibacter henchirensis TaxID=204072 RepID=A0A4Z0BQV0_9BURK|nr:hypothetical protein [Ramlibacter henchirensis]TFZ00780.1 hypothetical protein EZ313_20255 [Ramlibacter henchirensis]